MSAQEKGYNGWTNYETWAANLWLRNEEPSYRYWLERATDCLRGSFADSIHSRGANAIFELSRVMHDEFDENVPDTIDGFYLDLLNAALSEVNWHEIAKQWVEEAEEIEKRATV